jgi:hypothetical protein
VTLVAVSKEVPLGPLSASSSIPATHLLLAHGDTVYLHQLRPNPVSLHDIPSLLSSYASVNPSTLRLKVLSLVVMF